MMKKMIFVLLLGLGLAQVSPVAAMKAEEPKKAGFWNKRNIIKCAAVGTAALAFVGYSVYQSDKDGKDWSAGKVDFLKAKTFGTPASMLNTLKTIAMPFNVKYSVKNEKGDKFIAAKDGKTEVEDEKDALRKFNYFKLAGLVAYDAALLIAVIELGSYLITNEPKLTKTLLKLVGGKKAAQAAVAPAAK